MFSFGRLRSRWTSSLSVLVRGKEVRRILKRRESKIKCLNSALDAIMEEFFGQSGPTRGRSDLLCAEMGGTPFECTLSVQEVWYAMSHSRSSLTRKTTRLDADHIHRWSQSRTHDNTQSQAVMRVRVLYGAIKMLFSPYARWGHLNGIGPRYHSATASLKTDFLMTLG
jgi:hypothetical protein